MGLQAKIEKIGILCIEIMFFKLHTRIVDILNFDFDTKGLPCFLHHQSQITDREKLGKLVKDTHFARFRRCGDRQFNTTHSIANIKETACLSTRTIDRQGMPDRRLDAKTVEGCTKYTIIIETINQQFIGASFFSQYAIDNALVKISRP